MKLEVVFNESAFEAEVTPPVQHIERDFIREGQAKIIELSNLPKSGRDYYRPNPPGGKYRASAPGESPAIRTGALLRSIRELFPDHLTAELIVGAPYARYLEEGAGRILPRPFVRPMINSTLAKFEGGTLGRFNNGTNSRFQ